MRTREESLEEEVNQNNKKPKHSEWSEGQEKAIEAVLAGKNVFITGNAGCGKCLDLNTPVIMFDGSIKKAREIVINDILMGDDSTPRKVLSTCSGRSNMYKVKQQNGDDYIVNEPHILTLKLSDSRSGSSHIIDIPLNEYLQKSDIWKEVHKGFKVGVEFTENPIFLDPYLFGIWLGNTANRRNTQATENFRDFINLKEEILIKIKKKIVGSNYELLQQSNRIYQGSQEIVHRIIPTVSVLDETYDFIMDELDLLFSKHTIPFVYSRNTRAIRLELLAGLIDTCGYYDDGIYYIIQKSESLLKEIVFLCRSLGFAIESQYCAAYYQIAFWGNNLENIPVIGSRKTKKDKEESNIDPLITSIEIEALGEGDYCGFMLDGNSRFLLGDFTVTHNSHVIKHIISELGKNPNVVVRVSASTGIAALALEGCTLHSLFGKGIAEKSAEELYATYKNQKYIKQWKTITTLIIEEISMVSPDFLYKVDYVVRRIRNKPSVPFGGIQIVLLGDFYQLPPVRNTYQEKKTGYQRSIPDDYAFCFELDLWKDLKLETIELTKIFRQKGANMISALACVRVGIMSNEANLFFQNRVGAVLDISDGILPTVIYTKNVDVDKQNLQHLQKLPGVSKIFNYCSGNSGTGSTGLPWTIKTELQKNEEFLINNSRAPKSLELKIDAQVILLANLDIENKLANGSRGVVVDFEKESGFPVIKFAGCGGVTRPIGPHDFIQKCNESELLVSYYRQIPLTLGWSTTAHKLVLDF